MKRYRIQTLGSEIEFKLISAENADSFYHTLLKDNNPFLEEYIFSLITEDKYNSADLPAGIIPLVVFAALKQSGLMIGKYDFLDKLDAGRDSQAKNSYFSLYSTIIGVFPTYKLSELREMTLDDIMELVVFAEKVTGKEYTNTKKAREVMAKQDAEDSPTTPVKKGIKSLTKIDMDKIKEAINYNDHSNML